MRRSGLRSRKAERSLLIELEAPESQSQMSARRDIDVRKRVATPAVSWVAVTAFAAAELDMLPVPVVLVALVLEVGETIACVLLPPLLVLLPQGLQRLLPVELPFPVELLFH
jgi:hypothetical protein